MQSTNLTNHFLIAMPNLADPNFHHSVTYICAHNDEGAMGIIINHPLDIMLGEVLQQMDMEASDQNTDQTPIFQGGPVQIDRGFVLHPPLEKWDSSLNVSDKISITTSRDILRAIAIGQGPDDSLIALGYAGWSAGQIEQEIKENAWLNGPADDRIIFNTPVEKRWASAAASLGVELDKLTTDVGHA
jgi:putative transcriptional regulator